MALASLARWTRPQWLAGRALDRFLREIRPDEGWERVLRSAADRGSVVYVLRNVSSVDLLALDHLVRRLGLPRLGFANEHEGLIEPAASMLRRRRLPPAERLRAALAGGESAVLFMRRPPTVLERTMPGHRGHGEADDLLRVLIDLERTGERRIVFVSHTFVWTHRPERLGFSLVDTVFGSADFPGELRAAGQLLLTYRHCVVRAGEPLALGDFLAADQPAEPTDPPSAGAAARASGRGDGALLRRLTYALLVRVERERRAIVGPARKANDRVVEEVLRSPRLQALLREMAGPGERERQALTARARRMLRDLAAEPDPATLRGLELVADTLVDRVYAGIDIDREGIERVREAARKGSLVLLPSHKSHVDYLLLSYVLRKSALQLPLVAAGDNLSFFPLGPVLRRAGAFFIRRSFKGDRIYTAVVDAYVRRLIKTGHTIEFFLEGGRSRTGKLLPPMLGLLNMVVDAALGVEGKTISFVPVSIGYERMMEEGSYARELSGGAKRREDAAALLRIGGVLREKYGRANVQFGRIIELGELRRQMGAEGDITPARRRALVSRLAHLVMSEINRVTAVTPGSLVATALLSHARRGLSHVELVEQCARLTRLVRRLGARTTPSLVRSSGEMREHAIREAALLYVRGGLVRQHVPGDTLTGKARQRARIYTGDDVIYTVPDDKRILLDIAKNMIVHLFVDRALVSVAVLAPPGPPLALATVRERVQALSRLFKLEFMFRADAPFDRIFDETVEDMVGAGELARVGDLVTLGPGREGLDGRGWIGFYASVVRGVLEGYRVAARAVRTLVRGPMAPKDIVARALRAGEQMFLAGEIERSEAVSRPLVENALSAFVDQGYLGRSGGKLALTESFATEETAAAIETRVASYLLRRGADPGL